MLDTNLLVFRILRTVTDWVNPAQYGLVVVTSSEGRNLPYGKPEDVLSRDSAALNCHTNDDKLVRSILIPMPSDFLFNANIQVDANALLQSLTVA